MTESALRIATGVANRMGASRESACSRTTEIAEGRNCRREMPLGMVVRGERGIPRGKIPPRPIPRGEFGAGEFPARPFTRTKTGHRLLRVMHTRLLVHEISETCATKDGKVAGNWPGGNPPAGNRLRGIWRRGIHLYPSCNVFGWNTLRVLINPESS